MFKNIFGCDQMIESCRYREPEKIAITWQEAQVVQGRIRLVHDRKRAAWSIGFCNLKCVYDAEAEITKTN
jgi:hypothetical protein